MALHPDWRAFIELLNSHGVEYVVVGAFAVAQHGHVRTTGDIDVLVRNSQENAERVTRALDAFGMGSLGLRAADFTMSYSVIQLGQAPVRIDILTTCSGVTFEEVWAGKLMITIDGVPVNGRITPAARPDGGARVFRR